MLYWTIRVENIAMKLTKAIGKSPRQYLQTLYDEYMTSKNSDSIFDAIASLSDLESHLRSNHGKILQLAGVGWELESAEKVLKHNSNVIKSLEDLGVAILGENDLIELYNSEQLLFQSILI